MDEPFKAILGPRFASGGEWAHLTHENTPRHMLYNGVTAKHALEQRDLDTLELRNDKQGSIPITPTEMTVMRQVAGQSNN